MPCIRKRHFSMPELITRSAIASLSISVTPMRAAKGPIVSNNVVHPAAIYERDAIANSDIQNRGRKRSMSTANLNEPIRGVCFHTEA